MSFLFFFITISLLVFLVFQLPDVNHALVNVNTVLRTDLSNIVQKVCLIFNRILMQCVSVL